MFSKRRNFKCFLFNRNGVSKLRELPMNFLLGRTDLFGKTAMSGIVELQKLICKGPCRPNISRSVKEGLS